MNTTLAIGIDPGMRGAIAVLSGTDPVLVEDCPAVKGKGTRLELDARGMADLVRKVALELAHGHDAVRCVIEQQRGMPGQSSSAGMKLGQNFGCWVGGLAALGVSYQVVTPQSWQKVMLAGLPGGEATKGSARIAAGRLFPDADLGPKSRDGRPDALLLAEYARRRLVGGLT